MIEWAWVWSLLIGGVVAIIFRLLFKNYESPPRKSDCPSCTWYNPEAWTKFRYQARIDHMVTFHGVRREEVAEL